MPTLDETGRWVGAQAWVELRLFEAVGAWVATAPETEAKARFAAWSRHHAWRAELWLGHRPVVAGSDPDALVAPPDDATAAALALLAGTGADGPAVPSPDTPAGAASEGGAAGTGTRADARSGSEAEAGPDTSAAAGTGVGGDRGSSGGTTVERLGALVRVVLPRLAVAYDDRLAVTSPVQDGALRRTLRLVLADLAEDRHDGDRLLQSLLVTADDVRRAAAHQAAVEALLVG